MAVRMQHCDNCGEELGVFEHHSRYDGPRSCGAKACERAAREAVLAEQQDAYLNAVEDDFWRYR